MSELVRKVTTREKTYKVFIDSRDMVSHNNNNPSTYTYSLPISIANVTSVRLLTFRVPYSPTFVVIRSSKWLDPSIADDVALRDTINQKAAVLEAASLNVDPEKSTRVVTLFKTDGTVSLNVIETFSYSRRRDSDNALRTYDIFICTGTLATSSRTEWRIQDPSATSDSNIPMVGAESDDASAYASDPGTSSIAVSVIEENMYLRVDIGSLGRLRSVRSVYPQWKSFQVFRRGDISSYESVSYTCLKNHMSLIFSEDLASGLWKSVDTSKNSVAAANTAFYVLETNEANEAIITATAARDEIVEETAPVTISTIGISWKTRRGSNFIFPHATSIEFESWDTSVTSAAATLKKEYRHHTLLLEFTYLEEHETLVPASSIQSGGAGDTYSPLTLSGSSSFERGPLTLPKRERPR